MHRLPQQQIERRPSEPHSQDDLLPLLAGPPATIHHPEEIRLYPAHPLQAKSSPKVAMARCEVTDRGTVRLIDDDGVIIIMSEKMTTRLRPTSTLGQIGFKQKVHSQFLSHCLAYICTHHYPRVRICFVYLI